ncbi:MAG: LytR/AlgR family response regulator transcription factor [Granulosicoccaceae bacterium]
MNSISPRAIVVDDEPVLRFALKRQLQDLWPQLEIVAQAENGTQALELCLAHHPDVVFLDIQMPGLTGLEVAQQLLKQNFAGQVVFVTAFDQYAVEAFEREALDYLLKPVSPDRLQRTVARIQSQLQDAGEILGQDKLQAALQQLLGGEPALTPTQYLKWVKASYQDQLLVVPVEDVLYFEAGDKYTTVVTENRELLIRTPIKVLEEQLDPHLFWRIHRAYIVQVAAVSAARRDDTGRLGVLVREHHKELPVSRSYAHLFKQM